MSPAPGTPVRTVEIVEVAPRDGLQSDPTTLPTATKVELITRAVRAGLRRVEAVSFVNPRRVPQMADADQVMAALRADTETRALGASYIGIVVAGARAAGILTSVTVTASFGCPYEGEVDPDRLAEVLAQVAAMQPGEVALADSIGVAVPADVSTRVALARDVLAGSDVRLRCHFHNTRNT
ncbi:MAG: hydroxymethylglutaryl-CoA lyase, partial [Actinomycetes bacterium]